MQEKHSMRSMYINAFFRVSAKKKIDPPDIFSIFFYMLEIA